MGLREGDYVGFWCPPDLKKRLQEEARRGYRDLSKEVIKRLEESLAERPKEERREEVGR